MIILLEKTVLGGSKTKGPGSIEIGVVRMLVEDPTIKLDIG
jgi:CRISPR/Cas system CSM-associated protein Csm3 (group 7 of RAMP superfamily)